MVSSNTPIPAAEIQHRCIRLQQAMQANGIDAGLIIQPVDLLYFSGTAQNGVLCMPSHGDPILFVKRYFPRARKESPLDRVFAIMPSEASAASQAAMTIQQELLASIRPGMCAHDIDHQSVATARALGFKDSYLGVCGHQLSFVGHGDRNKQ